MDSHHNAALTPRGRARMVRIVIHQGLSYRKAAVLFHVDPKTVQRWTQRYRRYGHKGLYQRSSRPKRQPRRTPKRIVRQVIARRRQRWTMDRIAVNTGISRATVCRILQRNGLNRLSALEVKPPPQRYQHENPGDLLHVDIKKLRTLSGWFTPSPDSAPASLPPLAESMCMWQSMIAKGLPTQKYKTQRPPMQRS